MTTQPFSQGDVSTERPSPDNPPPASGRPRLLTVAAADDDIADGLAAGAVQPVLRGELTFED